MESPSHLGTLVIMFGHMPLESLMTTITMVPTTVPVQSTLVRLPLPLLDSIIFVNLESLVDDRATVKYTLKTHCGTVMDVVQATAAVHRLGCRGSVGPSHRQ